VNLELKIMKKSPTNKSSHVLDWDYEKRINAARALAVAKSQNKPIKYLIK
jgi:hypothetical protein